MLFSKILYFMPTALKLALLVILCIVYRFTSKKVKFEMYNFAPIWLIVIIHFIERLLYCLFLINVEDFNWFFKLLLVMWVICILGKKYGAWGIVKPFLYVIGFKFFLGWLPKVISITLVCIILFIVLYKISKYVKANISIKWLYKIIPAAAWFILTFFLSMTNALEIILFAIR